jgi:hypothetical protein
VLACSGFGEEGVERIIADTDGLVRWHLPVRLDAVLKAVEFPAAVSDLDAGLTRMDTDDFTHVEEWPEKITDEANFEWRRNFFE